uniref:Uncharacterized protein n=1 Tax=Fagus sylvatica TaxID=28930 RepID=A0A2N9GCW7_FAGSY
MGLTYKADVYSFGVVALEIVVGKNNMKYRPNENYVCLLDWAHVLQQRGNLMELVDPNLGDEDLLLRRRPSAPSSDQLPSTAHNSLVTRLRSILIFYGNQVRHLTESTPHLEQVSSENPRDEALAASPSTTHELATTCQMKGHKLSTGTSVGAVCGKRASLLFTAPIQKDCMVRMRSMEIHAQALPSSSQSPEVAAMEKQVRDLTANLQELTRQNEVLNQRLLQHENEKQKKDKGKSKERGDAEMTIEDSTAKWEQEIKAMKAQMGEMKDEFKGRATKNLDNLVHGTDSPFTKAVTSLPLPTKFRMPTLETFDGSKDPLDHLESFKTMMCLQGVPDEIMCRAFPTTLKGPARIWFKKLTPNSVGSFAQLSRLFFNHFIGGQRYGRPTTHLLNVKQKEGETLRSYLTRFNKETLLVDGADDKVVLTAFISGLQSGDFLFSVYKDPPSTMAEMMYEAQLHMNGEEALQARDQTSGKKRKWEHADRPIESYETKPKAQRNRNRRQEDRSGRGFNERFNHFTPLNAPVDHIFMQIRNDPALKWPGKLLTDPDKRPREKYYRFHRDHGHNTEDCYDLKRQIEELIKQGKLQRFVERGQREGRPQGARQQRPPTEALPRPPPLGEIRKMDKKPRLEDLPITFTEEDARKVFHPHDDALVVTLEITGYSTRQVLIDNGSSADIIYLTAFQQMKIGNDQLQPIETPLVGFAGTNVYPLGVISFQVVAGTYPKQAIKKVDFLVVDCSSAYNVIIGRPTLNRLRAVTSTYHLLVRFPTENGIGEMRGDQAMARECYLTSTNTEPVHQTLIVEERQNIAEPTEELEEIILIEGHEKKTMEVYYPEWLANVVMVKKSTGKWRMCVNFTDLNKVCLKDSYPLPRIDQLVDSTAGHKLLSFMDAFSGYNQIQMAEEDQEKTAFITSRGLFCYKAMPFGLKNAGATYQRLVNKMFHDQIGRNVEVYVDDMLVKSKKDDDHLADLKETFQTLRKYNMKLNPAKCVFGVFSALPRQGEELYLYLAVSAFATTGHALQYKAQALADFIAEFTHPLKEDEESGEGEAWTVNIDGSSTKEMSGAGVILVSPKKDKFEYALQLRFRATNNEAEYEALLAGLKLSKSMGIKALTVKSDSQLIVGQVKGEYEAKEDRMKKYFTAVKTLLTHFEKVELLQIPREDNVAADRLARLASSGIEIDGFIEIQGRPSTEEEIVNSITINTTWMSPITHYLREGTLPADRTEAHKLRIRASHFRLLGGILYKMGARSLAHKLTRAGYYWSSLLHDATQYVKTCDKCQRFANIPRVPPEEITPITSPWPFAQWGLDIMGPFPNPWQQFQKRMSRVLSGRMSSVDSGFRESCNGKQFDNGPFREMCSQLNIKNHYSSPRHPQANGQVEVTNRTLLKQIKTRLKGAKTVIPVEIGLTTLRTTFHKEEENEGQLRLNLDLLDETREKAAQRIALYQGKMARYYNTKVKLRRFEIGDWVLRKVTQATKDPSQGKLGPN